MSAFWAPNCNITTLVLKRLAASVCEPSPTVKLLPGRGSPMEGHKSGVDPRIESRIRELRQKAKHHLAKQEFAESLSCLDLAIDLNSSSYKLYRLRSIAHACLQDFEGSAADADRVIQLAPSIMDGYYHKGFAFFNLKQYAEAAHSFQQGMALNPADKQLRQGFWDSVALLTQTRTSV